MVNSFQLTINNQQFVMDLSQVIKKPHITEKSMRLVAENKYTFLVNLGADKKIIKKAIEKAFKVNVLGVKTIKIKGKKRRVGRFRRKEKKMPDIKKAIVQLKKGQKIDVFETGGK